MRVTKVIREYIEEELTKKMLEDKELKRLDEIRSANDKAWKEASDKLTNECNEKLAELARKFGYVEVSESGYCTLPHYNLHVPYYMGDKTSKEYRERSKQLQEIKQKAVREICFKLEMGAKKDQIQTMLDEVSF